MTPALKQAIEELYRVFAHVPRPREIDVSPYEDFEEYQRVLDGPLREVPPDDIGSFAGSVLLTVGLTTDYRYFLPRICECAMIEQTHIGFDPPNIADRLRRAGWAQWPEPGRRAVTDFFVAAFNASLVEWYGCVGPNEWLCGIMSIGGQPTPHLTAWRESTEFQAALRLAEFVGINPFKDDTLGAEDYWWGRLSAEHRREVAHWLFSTASLEQLKSWRGRYDPDDSYHGHWNIEAAIEDLEAKFSSC
jgi:hypothetical protein